MSAETLASMLGQSLFVGSMAMALLLLLSPLLRRFLGARAAYTLWISVPVVMVAVVLPQTATDGVAIPLTPPSMGAAMLIVNAASASGEVLPALLPFWAFGALASALLLLVRQCRYRRRIGRAAADRRGPVRWLAGPLGAPALIGLLRPRLLLPADFVDRYARDERRLILAHERVHWQRGDLWANALAALLLCLHWFNPLAYLTWRRFQRDQELACDAVVVARFPRLRHCYAQALLKSHPDALALLGCAWRSTHPLNERIAMLRRGCAAPATITVARLLLPLPVLAGGYAAWAQQPVRVAATEVSAQPRASRLGPVALPKPSSPLDDGVVFQQPPPRYPRAALRRGLSGKLVVVIDIDAQGRPTHTRIESSTPAGVFDQAVLEAIPQWRFAPPQRQGRAQPGRVRVPVTFVSTLTPVAAPATVATAALAKTWYRLDPGESLPAGICDVSARQNDGVWLCGIDEEARS